jgi:peptidoglycan/xylan/chitin deacetylase (PgdA/CDA1 family)/GT2 family glycosyltransferase
MLGRALESLSRQTCDQSAFEVIVVMDGPDDETREVVMEAPLERVRVVEQPHLGPTIALNAGAAAAEGRYLLFLDDDMVAAPQLIHAHLESQRAEDRVAVIGRIDLADESGGDPFTRYFARTFLRRYDEFAQGRRTVTFRDAYSGNLSVPRDAFLAVGGFLEGLARGYDVELARRLERHGLRFTYVAEAACTETSARSFDVTAAHFVRAGRTAWEMYERQPELLQTTELGLPWDAKPASLLLFRASLAVRPPLRLLRLIDRLVGGRAGSRWHSPLTRHLYWRGVRETIPTADAWRRLLYGTPILMYHAIGAPGERASRYVVPAATFRRQLRWLARRGYRVLDLGEYVALREANRLPPPRSVVITIDDGYLDNCTVAAPVLAEHGFPATVFAVTGRLGTPNDWSVGDALAGRRLASLEQLRDAGSLGITIGGHTRTHVALTDVSLERARSEVEGCKRDLEERLGTEVPAFAFPFGAANERLERLTAEAGFRCACGVRPGLNRARTPMFSLRRAEIRGTDSLFRFVLAIRLGDPNAVLSARRRRRRT